VTSDIDLALWLVEREADPQIAAAVAEEIEHVRTPAVWVQGSLRGDTATATTSR
jgi:transcriptional regulator GlxA family with amidase domain